MPLLPLQLLLFSLTFNWMLIHSAICSRLSISNILARFHEQRTTVANRVSKSVWTFLKKSMKHANFLFHTLYACLPAISSIFRLHALLSCRFFLLLAFLSYITFFNHFLIFVDFRQVTTWILFWQKYAAICLLLVWH